MTGLRLPSVQPNFAGKANSFMQGSVGAYRGQQPKQNTEIEPPGKTAGGVTGAMAGGAMAGATVGGPYAAPAAVAGAAIMGISYMLS